MRTALVCVVVCIAMALSMQSADAQPRDREICNRTFAWAFERRLIDKPMGEIVAEVGKRFLDSPYIAGSLDSAGDEHLVVNLREFDCVTFVENSLALARCIKGNTMTFEAYKTELERIRYRGGKQSGYTSRLHYFLDWIGDNVAKGIVTNVTQEIGGVPFRKTINFMSTHRDRYPHIESDAIADSIRAREQAISSAQFFWIPKEKLNAYSGKIQTGDIIAIVTSIPGLDIGHNGIAVRDKDGSLKMLHAPDVGKTVTMTQTPLAQYLKVHPKHAGVMIMRPLVPKGR